MPVFGMPDRRERETETPFDVPQEMAAAMRLMVQPAAGVIAMSAIGFGMASHAFGLWAGAVGGAMQAAQRMFAPFNPGEGTTAPMPAAAPKREKPTLKVVAQNEPEPRPAAEPVPAKPAVVAATPAPAKRPTPIAPPAVEKPAASATRAKAAARAAPKPKAEESAPAAKPAPSVQAEGLNKPRAIERPATPDDLKAISGIGPKLEKVLNELGVWTYAQIAAWDRPQVAWVDDYLSFKGRIDRDGWIEQARTLAAAPRGA